MRQSFLLLLLIFKCVAGLWAQQTPSVEQKNCQGTVIALFDALAELSAEKAKTLCAPGITILENGQVWNFDSLAVRINARKVKSADFKRVNKIDFIETTLAGESAWVSYFNQAVITSSGRTVTVKWLETVILKKSGNDWRIVLLHSTELLRTP